MKMGRTFQMGLLERIAVVDSKAGVGPACEAAVVLVEPDEK